MHDGAQQHLVAMSVKLRLAEAEIDSDPEQAKQTLEELRGEVQSTIQHLRDLAHQIYPPLLADRGLPEALNGAVARASAPVSLTVAGDGTPPLSVGDRGLRLLRRARGHRGGDRSDLGVGRRGGRAACCSRCGVRWARGRRLMVIGDFVDTIGGTLVVEPADDGGTHLRASVPLG